MSTKGADWVGRLALLAPVVLVNAVAVAGQYVWADTSLPRWVVFTVINLTAVGFASALESIAIYLQYEAHQAQMAGDSAWKLKAGAYGVALLVGALNYWHWADPITHGPTPAAVAFGGLSAISPWLWGIRSRSLHRAKLRDLGLIEERAVKFSSARWFLYPLATFRAFRLAVWVGETDPKAAVGLHSTSKPQPQELELGGDVPSPDAPPAFTSNPEPEPAPRPAARKAPQRTTRRGTTDADRLRIIREVLANNPAAGRPVVSQAISNAGHTPGGNHVVARLLREAKEELTDPDRERTASHG